MSAEYWAIYAAVTIANAALFVATLQIGFRVKHLMRICKRAAWDEGYTQATRDSEIDWFASDNPYEETA